MNNEIEKQVELELEKRRKSRAQAHSNQESYNQRLLESFPLALPSPEELFYRNSFTGDDELDYLKGRAIFEGKAWSEVDFDILYDDYVQFVPLSPKGMIYYLPAFLGYFYDLKHPSSEFRQNLLAGICEGFRIPGIDELEAWSKSKNKPAADYAAFDAINPEQSKLVALFLANEAILSADSYNAHCAQDALTSYWGNFLIF